MRVPNKIYTYNDSIISKFPVILRELKKEELSVLSLYKRVETQIEGINEYLQILDYLFAMNKIEMDYKKGVLIYVD